MTALASEVFPIPQFDEEARTGSCASYALRFARHGLPGLVLANAALGEGSRFISSSPLGLRHDQQEDHGAPQVHCGGKPGDPHAQPVDGSSRDDPASLRT